MWNTDIFHHQHENSVDLLISVSDRIARAFNKSGATGVVALDIFKAFIRFLHAGLLHKHKSYWTSGQVFGFILCFLSIAQFRVVLEETSLQEDAVNGGVSQAPLLVLNFSYYPLMTFLMMLSVICLSVLMMLISTLSVARHLICGNN